MTDQPIYRCVVLAKTPRGCLTGASTITSKSHIIQLLLTGYAGAPIQHMVANVDMGLVLEEEGGQLQV